MLMMDLKEYLWWLAADIHRQHKELELRLRSKRKINKNYSFKLLSEFAKLDFLNPIFKTDLNSI
jgi:hypothetical protein